MTEIEWYMIVFVMIMPTLGIILTTILILKLLEIIYKMLESKFETVTKRVPSITIIDQDVIQLESVLKEYIRQSDIVDDTETDRRLIGFANKFVKAIHTQKQQIKLLEIEDQRKAMEEYFASLNIEDEYIEKIRPEVVDLTDIVSERSPETEELAKIVDDTNRQNKELDKDSKKKK